MGPLGPPLERYWAVLGPSWGHLGPLLWGGAGGDGGTGGEGGGYDIGRCRRSLEQSDLAVQVVAPLT